MKSRTKYDAANALLLIDLQNDFVKGGALAVKGGLEVVDLANDLMPHFEYVVSTQDWHPADHQSFASQHPELSIGEQFLLNGLPQTVWPDHCVAGTPGAEFVSHLNQDRIDHVAQKGTDRQIDSYSGFYDNGRRHSTGLADHLRQQGIQNLYAMGLATDYCVAASVLDAITEGFRVTLILDGCRGVDLKSGDIDRSVDEMKHAGAEVLYSNDIRK